VKLLAKKIIAVLVAVIVVQVAVPLAVTVDNNTSATIKTHDASPLTEQEDENSDSNLKFLSLPAVTEAPAKIFHYLDLPGIKLITHIDEIPTPPPL